MQTIEDRIREIIADELSADPDIVTLDARFVEELGADSLDVVEMVMRFEEEFEIEIPDDAMSEWNRVGDAVQYVGSRTKP